MIHHTIVTSDAKKTCARVRSFLSFESCCLLTSWTAGATGQELDQYLNKHRQSTDTDYDRVVYIGDGSNDFCAVLRLRRYFTFFFPLVLHHSFPRPNSQDIVLCRRFRGLEYKIAEECAKGASSRLRCTVEYWSGAWEVEEKFKAYTQPSSLDAFN